MRTPAEFCHHAMLDYERQWTEAAGHQQRHPLKVKMEMLREVTAQAGDDPGAFERLLSEGENSDDPYRALLCAELLPHWREFVAASSET